MISSIPAAEIPSLGITIANVRYNNEFQRQRAFQMATFNMKHPEYTGLRNQPWGAWIRHVAGLFDVYHVSSDDQVRFLAHFVTFDLQHSLTLQVDQSLRHWLAILTQHAQRLALSPQDLRRLLPDVVQGTDTVIQFYERLRAFKAQDPGAISDTRLADQFDYGLNPHLRLFMAHSPTNTTLESLLDAAIHVESRLSKGG
jgi:hypothetical protein